MRVRIRCRPLTHTHNTRGNNLVRCSEKPEFISTDFHQGNVRFQYHPKPVITLRSEVINECDGATVVDSLAPTKFLAEVYTEFDADEFGINKRKCGKVEGDVNFLNLLG